MASGGERLRIAALIPALNEEEALPAVLDELTGGVARGEGAERVDQVVVVDNGSTDATAEAARRGGACVVTEPRRGYGEACLAGLARMGQWERRPDVVVFLDGDGSDDPGDLPRLLAPLADGSADFVLGVREGEVPFHARIGNSLVRVGARLLHGARFSDLGPFRAIRFSALRALEMDDRNWGWTLQMQLRAHHAGLRVREVPVRHRPRRGGRSKVSGTVKGSVAAGLKMLATLVTELPVGRRLRRRVRRGRPRDP